MAGILGNKEEHPDALNRRYRVGKDRHGRPWETLIDRRYDAPACPIKAKFKAPWYPPSNINYVKWSVNEDGAARIDIDYALIKADLYEAHKDWNAKLLKVGSGMQGDKFNPSDPGAQVLDAVGPKPKPIEAVIAAEAGDPWILGFSDKMPAWAVPLFVKIVKDETAFMREAENRVLAQFAAIVEEKQIEKDPWGHIKREHDPKFDGPKRNRGRPRMTYEEKQIAARKRFEAKKLVSTK